MNKITHWRRIQIRTFLLLLMISLNSNAVEVTAEFSAGVGISDNIARTAVDEIDETTALLGVVLDINQKSSRVDVSLRSNFDYLDYLDDTYKSEVVGGLAAFASFTLLDEQMTWVVEDSFGQQLLNPFSPARPDNRENVNYFQTGPNIRFRPNGRNRIGIDLRYANVNYEERDVDNDRLSASLSLGRAFRRGAILWLVGRTSKVEYDNGGLSSDFDRNEVFLRYEATGNKNSVAFDVGWAEIDIDGVASDGILARLEWTRTLSANGELQVSGGTEYSDQGDVFLYNQGVSSDIRDTADVPVATDPLTNKFFDATYTLAVDRNTIRVSVGWRDEDYEGDLSNDREIMRAAASFSRDITRNLLGGLSLRYRSREFRDPPDSDDEISVSANVDYSFGPALQMSLELQDFRRSSNAQDGDYDESRAFLRLIYTPAWAR